MSYAYRTLSIILTPEWIPSTSRLQYSTVLSRVPNIFTTVGYSMMCVLQSFEGLLLATMSVNHTVLIFFNCTYDCIITTV